MRVTNSMLVSNFMNNLNNNLAKLDKLQSQMASNKKYAHVSDDPVSVIYSQQANYKLARLGQYRENVDMAQSWLTTTETSLLELNSLITSAYEQCIDLSTDVKTATDKQAASEYLGQLAEQLVQSLNATFGDKFVYGGYNTTGYVEGSKLVNPFTVETNPDNGEKQLYFNGISLIDGTDKTTGDDKSAVLNNMMNEALSFDIGTGVEIDVTLNGILVAGQGDTNLYKIFNDFYEAAKAGASADELKAFITPLQNAQNEMLAYVAEIGGRTKRLDIIATRYEQDDINYTQMKSDAEDADQAEVIMNYKMAEAVYKAALSTGAYIIQPTLMDFLN